jgi:uncharacterized protein YndB with AHSA1/START domain
MGRYTLVRDIEASPERVFAAFVEPALVVDWMDAREIRDATGPLDVAGSRFTLVIRGPWKFRAEVLDVQRSIRHESAGRGPLGSSYHNTAVLTPRDDGTHLELTTLYDWPLGPIGRLIDRHWMERRPRTIANRELDRLVALVSQPAASPDAGVG